MMRARGDHDEFGYLGTAFVGGGGRLPTVGQPA